MYAKSVTEDDKLLFGVSRMFAARGVPREQQSQGRGPEHAHTKSEKADNADLHGYGGGHSGREKSSAGTAPTLL